MVDLVACRSRLPGRHLPAVSDLCLNAATTIQLRALIRAGIPSFAPRFVFRAMQDLHSHSPAGRMRSRLSALRHATVHEPAVGAGTPSVICNPRHQRVKPAMIMVDRAACESLYDSGIDYRVHFVSECQFIPGT